MTGFEFYGRTVDTIHVEVSSQCNLQCPMCPRMDGEQPNPNLEEGQLTLEQFKEAIPVDYVEKLKHLYFCGNYGDPAMAKELLSIITYLRQHNRDLLIGMHSNGSLRTPEWWADLIRAFGGPHYLIFSIDGLEDTNAVYRVRSNWSKIMTNAKAAIAAGGNCQWHYLIFEHNKHQVDAAEVLSKEMGFTQFQRKQTLRQLVFKRPGLKPGDMERYEENTAKSDDPVICQAQREKSLYLSAKGQFYPCCYLGDQSMMPKPRQDVDYNNLRLMNRMPLKPACDVCTDKCSSIGGRNVTERQYITE